MEKEVKQMKRTARARLMVSTKESKTSTRNQSAWINSKISIRYNFIFHVNNAIIIMFIIIILCHRYQ